MLAVYSADRAWRMELERALRAHGLSVRSASRPAELTKCLADGQVRTVVADATPEARRDVQRAVTVQGYLCASPGETMESIVHRAMSLFSERHAPPG
ncbi:hypothetical protein [Gemmatimonas sp.]